MPWRWFSARAVSTSGAASAAIATRSAAASSGLDRPRRRVEVLDRAARRAGVGEQADGLGDAARLVREAAFAVDVERQRRRLGDASDVRDELVARDLHVELAERPGEAGARRRERLEPHRREQLGRADVPRVRHHEDLLALVQRPEARLSISGHRPQCTCRGAPRVSLQMGHGRPQFRPVKSPPDRDSIPIRTQPPFADLPKGTHAVSSSPPPRISQSCSPPGWRSCRCPQRGRSRRREVRRRTPTLHRVTLLTGDTVHVTTRRDGKRSISLEAGPDGTLPEAAITEVGEHAYVVPKAALPLLAAHRLDLDLFDVAALIDQRYDDAHRSTLPVIVDYGAGAEAAAESKAARLAARTQDGHARVARRSGLRGREASRARLLALTHRRAERRRRLDRPRGGSHARRPGRAGARDAGHIRGADPRARGLGRRLRRDRLDRGRARHGLRPVPPRPRQCRSPRAPTSRPTPASSTATATAPTSPPRSPAPAPVPAAPTGVSRRARS